MSNNRIKRTITAEEFLYSSSIGLILIGAIIGVYCKSIINNSTTLCINYLLSFQSTKNSGSLLHYNHTNGAIEKLNGASRKTQFTLSCIVMLSQIIILVTVIFIVYKCFCEKTCDNDIIENIIVT